MSTMHHRKKDHHMRLNKRSHQRNTESFNTKAERRSQWRNFVETQSMKLAFGTALVAFAAVITLVIAHQQGSLPHSRTAAATACQFQKADQPLNVAFCDSFDQPMGTGNRSGDLDGNVWGLSRTTSGSQFGGGSPAVQWCASSQKQPNGTTKTVLPEHDITVASGEMIESVNDCGSLSTPGGFGNVTVLAEYPKQPFDIANRTGTVTFDVGADSEGGHAAWPTFVYTDQPVPAPYQSAAAEQPFARNSFGFTLFKLDNTTCQYVGEMFDTRNYALHSSFDNSLDFNFTRTGCVQPPTRFGQLNHFEVRMSQNHVEVWGSDAGSTTLKQLVVADNVNLPLTRGLIWMEDVHYNACKDDTQCDHTFAWDNVGFDGPVLPRDWATDVNDKGTLLGNNSEELGWPVSGGGTTGSLTVPGIGADKIANASAAILTLNYGPQGSTTLTYRVNGNTWHTQAWPFPDNGSNWSWRTIAMPVPLSELVAGNNAVEIKSSAPAAIANIDIILVAGGGMPTCYNPSNCAGSQFSGSGTPDTTAPSVPTNLHGTGTTNSSVALAWSVSTDNTGGTGLAGYKLYRNNTLVATIPAGTTTYTDTNLSASTTYTYTISAYDNAGNESARSTSVSATTNATAAVQGDCTNDGHVNINDLSTLLSHYGAVYAACDFNNDSTVTVLDLSILMSNYGR